MLLQKIKGIIIVFAICSIFAIVSFLSGHNMQKIETLGRNVLFLLDAGHGTPDGGTVGADKTTTEAELNLAITQKVSEILSLKNISHQLTRNTADSIYSEGDTIHEKKVSDVRNRIAIASELPETPLISIHMNSFPDSSVYGIQVFYGNGENAENTARKMQTLFNQKLQPNHQKVAKPISKNIYLFSHIDNPVILIECGFLSNHSELEKLKSPDHQEKIAKIIADVLEEWS